MRQFDHYASEVGKLPSLLLMENAGRGAAAAITRHFPGRSCVVVCGSGNNGGDGFVVARRLLTLGVGVRVLCSTPHERLSPDAAVMQQAYQALGGRSDVLTPEALASAGASISTLIVDALLGTGLDRDVAGPFARVIDAMNRAPCPVLSLDVPSGIDADTGRALGVAVHADVTVTFAHPKLGLLTPRGLAHSGRLEVVDIGVPGRLVEHVGHSAVTVEASDLSPLVEPRGVMSHKGHSGRVAVVAGSAGTIGAARLVARAALRAGAGLVTMINFDEVVTRLEAQVSEAMTARLNPAAPAESLLALARESDALVIGPGLGVNERTRELVEAALELECIKIIDADALSVLEANPGVLAKSSRTILTPHPGEAGRLLGTSASAIEDDRFGSLARLVDLTQSVVVLKGARSLVGAPGQLPRVNMTGSPVLATGGSGDVLAGMLGAFSVGRTPSAAAELAVGLHGLAGESWQHRTGADRGLLASEVADELPLVLAQLSGATRQMTD